MFKKFVKTIFLKEKKYFLFIFVSVVLSIFSYILGNNIILGVKDYLKEQVKPLLGADIVLSSDSKIDYLDFSYFESYFKKAETIEIDSTLFDKNNKPILYEFVYHSENYPFYETFTYDIINDDGFAVVDKLTYETFGDYLEIFGEKIKVKGIINKRPLGEISIYTNDKKIYLPLSLFNTELNETNSRLNYKIYLNFINNYDEKVVLSLKEKAKEFSIIVRSINDRQDSIGEITDRFYFFINGFNLVIFILTFFIVILSLESFFKKNKSNFGLLNIFGMTKKSIFIYSFISIFVLFFVSFLFSILLNYLALYFLSREFSFFSFYYESIIKGFLIMFILLFVGVFSPFYKIVKSNINNLLKDSNDFSNFAPRDYFTYLFLIFISFFLINIISGIDMFYSFIFTIVSIIFVVLFYIFIKAILNFSFKKLSKRIKNFYIFDAIRSTIKPGNVSFLIVFSSIISFLSIFVFFVFSLSFVSYLQNLTKDSNDMFVINVSSDDLEKINPYFNSDEIYEIVSLRIEKINGLSLDKYLNTQTVSREFSREFFSTTNNLNNKIEKGDKLKSGYVSVDSEFASRLGLRLGDTISFNVAGLQKELIVINFREAVRSGTNPFFFFMLDKDDFKNFPKTYILSYKQETKEKDLEVNLSKLTSGNLTFINTKDIIDIVLVVAISILKVVYFSLFYIFVFSFISFLVSILFLKSFKDYKIKILHILGGLKHSLFLGLKFEYFYLILIGLIFSLFFGSLILFVSFLFISYFSISYFYYFICILFLIILFLLINIFIYFYSN
ncbi:hypothetical protein HUU51_01910 [Candidatus Gracilibacteria bacterium]|nr:hypothetical protein [Candidatus Gracilibacteria bacterium]